MLILSLMYSSFLSDPLSSIALLIVLKHCSPISLWTLQTCRNCILLCTGQYAKFLWDAVLVTDYYWGLCILMVLTRPAALYCGTTTVHVRVTVTSLCWMTYKFLVFSLNSLPGRPQERMCRRLGCRLGL